MITFPNAKINLGLSVLKKRADGYHQIETIYYPVGLSDILEIIPSPDQAPLFESSGLDITGPPQQNLCLRAYHAMTEYFNFPPVIMYLHKQIPLGAGLGGGSSDAASVISLINTLFELKVDPAQLHLIVADIGSDCAFFLENRPALATGRGECLEPVAVDLSEYFLIIVKPPVSVSTAAAYAGITPRERSFSLKEVISQPVHHWQQLLANDFEPWIFRQFPEVQVIKNTLIEHGAIYASLTGSGSAVFGIFEKALPDASLFPGCFTWTGKCS